MNCTHKKSFLSSVSYSLRMFVSNHACKLSISVLWVALFLALTSENTYVVTTALTLSLPVSMYFLMNFKKHCVSWPRPYFSWRELVNDDVMRMHKTDFSYRDGIKSSCCGGSVKGEAEMRAAMYQGEG